VRAPHARATYTQPNPSPNLPYAARPHHFTPCCSPARAPPPRPAAPAAGGGAARRPEAQTPDRDRSATPATTANLRRDCGAAGLGAGRPARSRTPNSVHVRGLQLRGCWACPGCLPPRPSSARAVRAAQQGVPQRVRGLREAKHMTLPSPEAALARMRRARGARVAWGPHAGDSVACCPPQLNASRGSCAQGSSARATWRPRARCARRCRRPAWACASPPARRPRTRRPRTRTRTTAGTASRRAAALPLSTLSLPSRARRVPGIVAHTATDCMGRHAARTAA